MKCSNNVCKKCLFAAFLLFISFFFLAVFSWYTSPFILCSDGFDSAFFRLVGQGMTRGYVPYRDIFDFKGPYLFFIQYIGQLISYGRLGIFCVQCVNLWLSLLLICQVYSLHGIVNRKTQILLLLPILLIASRTFDGGNLTEEYSLVPLLSCIVLCLLCFQHWEDRSPFWRQRFYALTGAWFGICFGYLSMIRITNTALIASSALVVSIYLLSEKRFRQFVLCFFTFIAGFLVSLIPVVIYVVRKHLLSELLEAVFVLGYAYSKEQDFSTHLIQVLFSGRVILLVLAFASLLLSYQYKTGSAKERRVLLFGLLFSFFAISSGNNYAHYYTLLLPLLAVLQASLFPLALGLAKRKPKAARLAGTALLLTLFCFAVKGLGQTALFICFPHYYQDRELAQEIAQQIPEEDKNSVLAYNTTLSWYTYTDCFPCIRYCGWQNHYIKLMPEISEDFERSFQIAPPHWLILPFSSQDYPDFMKKALDAAYTLYYENSSYSLYRLTGADFLSSQ